MTALVFLLPGVTDTADGFVASHFNMIGDFGRVFNPVADKLTQLVTIVFFLPVLK